MGIDLKGFVMSIKSMFKDYSNSSNGSTSDCGSPYARMDRTHSMKMEEESRRAQKLIHKTLQYADKPGPKALSS